MARLWPTLHHTDRKKEVLDLLDQGLRASQCPMQPPRQPLTGHRHRPPQTQWYSRRHWSRADPPLGLGGSPGCVNRSPARDRPSPTLSPEPPNGRSHSHLKKKKDTQPWNTQATQVHCPVLEGNLEASPKHTPQRILPKTQKKGSSKPRQTPGCGSESDPVLHTTSKALASGVPEWCS